MVNRQDAGQFMPRKAWQKLNLLVRQRKGRKGRSGTSLALAPDPGNVMEDVAVQCPNRAAELHMEDLRKVKACDHNEMLRIKTIASHIPASSKKTSLQYAIP